MRTIEEVINELANYQRMAGVKVLQIESYKDLANIAEIIFIDGYTKALDWVRSE